MEIKACIFDLDGVLCDTAKYHYQAWKELADDWGISFTQEDNERLKGVSRMQSLEILLEIGGICLSEEKKEAAAERKNERYVAWIRQMDSSEIKPGVVEFLKDCKKEGAKIVLGSASKNARLILERLKLSSCFDHIVDGNLVRMAKPDPEVFLKGAIAAGVLPKNCVVFEDSKAGIDAASCAGMKSVGVGGHKNLRDADQRIYGFENLTMGTVRQWF